MKQIDSEQFLNLMVDLKIILGTTRVNTRSLIQMKEGSLIELDQRAGEPVEIEANGTVVASGEVVVIDEKFGVRIFSVLRNDQ